MAGAKATASQIEVERTKSFAFMSIATARAKVADAAGARDSIEKAKAAAALVTNKSHGDDTDKWRTYGKIAATRVAIRDVTGAKRPRIRSPISG